MSDEYIKREDAYKVVKVLHKSGDIGVYTHVMAELLISDIPSADVVERTSCKTCSNGEVDEGYVRCNSYRERGEWVEDKKTEREHQLYFHKVWTCPFCGEQECRPKPTNFCPNCGARMVDDDTRSDE